MAVLPGKMGEQRIDPAVGAGLGPRRDSAGFDEAKTEPVREIATSSPERG